MKNPYDLMRVVMKFISVGLLNELDYLIAAAKWKQVFGSKAHLCRAHFAC
jgi:hypothetical protein